jgi:hypothetical protein
MKFKHRPHSRSEILSRLRCSRCTDDQDIQPSCRTAAHPQQSQAHNSKFFFGQLHDDDDDDSTDVSSDGSQTISSRLPLLHHHLGGASDKSISSVSSFLHSARQAYDVLHAQQTVNPLDDEQRIQQPNVPNPVIRISSEGHRSSVSAVSIDSFSLAADTMMAHSTTSRKSIENTQTFHHWMDADYSTIDDESLYLTELEESKSKSLSKGANNPSKLPMNTSAFKEQRRRDDDLQDNKSHPRSYKTQSLPSSHGHRTEPAALSIMHKKRSTFFPPIQEDSQFIDSDWEDDIVRDVAASYHAGEDFLFLDTDDEQSLSDIQTLSSQSNSLASTLNHFQNDIRKEFEAEIAADEAAHRKRLQQLLRKCKTLPVSAFANPTKNRMNPTQMMNGKTCVDNVRPSDLTQSTGTTTEEPKIEKRGMITGSKTVTPRTSAGKVAISEPKYKEATRLTIESILQDVDSFLSLDCESEERSESALHLSAQNVGKSPNHHLTPSDTTTKTPNRSNKQSSFTSEKGPIYHGGKPTNYILSQNIPNRFQQQQQLHVETMMGLDRSNPIYSGTAKYFTGDGRVIRSTSSDSSDSSVQYEHFDRKKKHGNITTTTNKVDDDSVTTITSDSDIRTVATNATPLSSGSDFDIRSVAAMLSMSTKHQHSPSIPNKKNGYNGPISKL